MLSISCRVDVSKFPAITFFFFPPVAAAMVDDCFAVGGCSSCTIFRFKIIAHTAVNVMPSEVVMSSLLATLLCSRP